MRLRPRNLIHATVLVFFALRVVPLSCAADLTADQVRELLAKADRAKPADLKGKDLSADVAGADFTEADLEGTVLKGLSRRGKGDGPGDDSRQGDLLAPSG